MMVPMREIRGCMPGGFCCAWRAAGAGGVLMGTGIPGVVFWEKGGRGGRESGGRGGREEEGGGGRKRGEEYTGKEKQVYMYKNKLETF